VHAFAGGDVAAIVAAFDSEGYLRDAEGRQHSREGPDGVSDYYQRLFSTGGGIPMETCALVDDGRNCVLEYNVGGVGSHAAAASRWGRGFRAWSRRKARSRSALRRHHSPAGPRRVVGVSDQQAPGAEQRLRQADPRPEGTGCRPSPQEARARVTSQRCD
jgi:hypothetical protein